MSVDPIAIAFAVPIAATCLDVSAPIWSAVKSLICAVVSALTSAVVSAATVSTVRLAMFASDPMSADPMLIAPATPIAAT